MLLNLEAGKSYLFSDIQYMRVRESPAAALFTRVSEALTMLKPFTPHDPRIKKVLIYNGCGGLGDQIMTWPIARILHNRGYEIHILADPHHDQSWHGFPWIKTITLVPAYWDQIQNFDAHLIFEIISNSYIHEGIMQPVDTMLRLIGMDPNSVPAEEKRTSPELTPIEKRLAEVGYPGKEIAFYQLSASQNNRSLTPQKSIEILRALAGAYPEVHWVALSGSIISGAYAPLVPRDLPNVEVREFPRIRLLWSMISRAKLCVGPDSMLLHAAGAFGVPAIGFWGVYGPECRTAYYPQHIPILHREVCPHAPCAWNAKGLPKFCPPVIQRPEDDFCEVTLAVTPEEVVELARPILRPN